MPSRLGQCHPLSAGSSPARSTMPCSFPSRPRSTCGTRTKRRPSAGSSTRCDEMRRDGLDRLGARSTKRRRSPSRRSARSRTHGLLGSHDPARVRRARAVAHRRTRACSAWSRSLDRVARRAARRALRARLQGHRAVRHDGAEGALPPDARARRDARRVRADRAGDRIGRAEHHDAARDRATTARTGCSTAGSTGSATAIAPA